MPFNKSPYSNIRAQKINILIREHDNKNIQHKSEKNEKLLMMRMMIYKAMTKVKKC